MQETQVQKTTYRTFDSVEELLQYTDDRKAEREYESRSILSNHSFTGRRFRDWSGVEKAARSAWDEGLETLDRMTADLGSVELPKPKDRRRRTATPGKSTRCPTTSRPWA